MAKFVSFFTVALLFSLLSLSFAGRPEPAFVDATLMKTQQHEVEAKQAEMEETCGGVGEEECLMRRTLAAHLDYIYTQNHKP
ncbi:unnamed protein product [Coffea canephora]|uniref:Phytosulfokine n=1 Tax=Coffea canephora TaxID=49390 RepID=A0A068U2V7_COFCA|nr:unnamed protein product [Coffea canephora]